MNFSIFTQRLKLFGLEYFKRYYAIYRAEVGNNEDPDNLGRVQLIIPQLYGKGVVYKYWAKPKGLFSGKGIGSFMIPEIGDNIWVEFEGGDSKYPVWSYGHWSIDEVPENATIENKVIQTISGNKIEFNDKDKLIKITVADTLFSVELNGTGVSIVADKVSIGTLNESSEPATLGETLTTKLETIVDKVLDTLTGIETLTVGTAMGPSTVPVNVATFTNLKASLVSFKSTLNEIQSEKVTLD